MAPNFRLVLRSVVVAVIFSAGYLVGTLNQPTAHAQLGDIGKDMLNQAAGSEGMLGQAGELGTAITEMQDHVSGLQQNIDTLNKVKAALGG